MVNVRRAILKRLKETGRSRYWLAATVSEEMSMATVYQYLAGKQDMIGTNIEKLLDVLRLTIVPAPDSARDSKSGVRRSAKREQT